MSKPYGFQLRRSKGWRMPPNSMSVARPSVFGNPCTCSWPYGCPYSPEFERGAWEDDAGQVSPLRCCVDVYRHYVEMGLRGEGTATGRLEFMLDGMLGYPRRAKLITALPRARAKNLGCFCSLDKPCHRNVLLEIANR